MGIRERDFDAETRRHGESAEKAALVGTTVSWRIRDLKKRMSAEEAEAASRFFGAARAPGDAHDGGRAQAARRQFFQQIAEISAEFMPGGA
jgi:hypothetical protein